jgi:homoserine acetyltransferase
MNDKPNRPNVSLKDEWPIKHAMLFDWQFDKSKTLKDILKRAEGYHFYVKINENLIITASRQNSQVIFVLRKKNKEGGTLLLIQTNKGHYGFDKIKNVGMNMYGNRLGIRIEPNKLTPDQTG